MEIFKTLLALACAIVLISFGAWCFFFTEQAVTKARTSRPPYWKKIPIYNRIWATVDGDYYPVTVKIMGVAMMTMGVFLFSISLYKLSF